MPEAVEHASNVWPEGQEYLRPVICTAYLVVVCIMSVLFTRRLPPRWDAFKRMPLMQHLVITLLGGSLLFTFVSAIIVLGVGSSYSEASCNVGIWLCVLLYAGTKAILYVLLLEKLHVVHSHTAMGKKPRLQSWWYRFGLVAFVAWIAVAATMIAGRVALIRRHDGACIIGLQIWSTIPMLTVDAITNTYLTSAFIVPIWKSAFPKAQRLARVSAIAAFASLVTSFANILALTIQHGHQLSWVCLGSCSLDVAFNSACVYFVTTAGRQRDEMTTQKSSVHDATAVGSRSRLSRRQFQFPGSTAGASDTTTCGVGVIVVEEIRVDEDLEASFPDSRKRNRDMLFSNTPTTTVSFKEPLRDDEEATLAAPGSEKLSAQAYLPNI
ncbi:hypothetical protein JCM11641_007607 [Rhodosporidiobolus odoratus]